MTYPGFARLLSSPSMAFVLAALVVAACGYLVYRGARRQPAGAAYWKLLSLVAEVCIAASLLGLATFAGAMKIGADHQLLEERLRVSQSAVAERMRLAAINHCVAPAPRSALAPYSPALARKELCAIARSFDASMAHDADWESAETSLRDFSSKYPGCIENVFTRHSDCGDTVQAATQLAADIGILRMHRQAARGDEAISAMLQAPNSWGFLLFVFLVAAVGVSIRCARAASAFVASRNSGAA